MRVPSNIKQAFNSILIIEDEPAHARLLERALKEFSVETHHVLSGETAIEALKTKVIDLVFCDLKLPDLQGTEILNHIHSHYPSLPVVVLTSSSRLEDVVSAMQVGAWDYMVKQAPEDLQTRLRLILERTVQRKLQSERESILQSERNAFWAATQASPDGLALVDVKGKVIFANESFEDFWRLICREPKETQERCLIEAISSWDLPFSKNLSEQLQNANEQTLWSAELQLKTQDQEGATRSRFFELRLSEMEANAEGEFQAQGLRVLWLRDMTRKKEEEKLRRDLLSTTSHDLKGPLGAILTSAELLLDGGYVPDEKAREMITRVSSCARTCVTIIDELLSARLIEDGVMVIRPREMLAREAIEDVVLDFQSMAKARNIDLHFEVQNELLTVQADKIALKRILGNLISNALKFTPKEGSVKVAVESVGEEVKISVEDSGTGIDPKARRSLFERYARLDEHHSIDGTGLGLFVVKNLVDAHGGRIEVQSAQGKGTVFTIFLPVVSTQIACLK